MNRSIIASDTYQLGATSDYTILQPLGEGSESLEFSSKLSASWRKFSHSSTHVSGVVADVGFIPAMNTTTAISDVLMDELLSPEDKEARAKGLALVARFEYLIETDEGFRRWLQTGLDQAEAGEVFAFDESDWKE
jgi:hypothetical protein